MWSQILLGDQDKSGSEQPINRFKHASCLNNEDLYIYGGKKLTPDGLSISSTHSNLKDFWKLELRTGRWTEIKPKILNNNTSSNTTSSRSRILPSRLRLRSQQEESFWPPPLVDATICSYKNSLYLFGGEIGLQAHDELKTRTPLWIYDIQNDEWRKWENSGAEAPSPRRCHSATVYSEYMLIYGGYQDLKGSIGCLWAFHFDTESWHLFSSPDNKVPRNGLSSFNKYFQKGYRLRYNNPNACSEEVTNNLTIIQPLKRHSHAAQFHGTSLWVYGGMSDLEDLQDLWRFDFDTKKWSQIKKKSAWPGQLKGHSLLKALNSLFIFGGIKSDYHKKFNEDLWRYDFINESWQKITIHGAKPHARSFPNYIMLPALIRILPAKRSKARRSSIEDGYWWDFSAEDETLSSYNLSESASTSGNVARRNSGGNEYLLLEGDNDIVESCVAESTTIIDNDKENAITSCINAYADDQEEYEDELEETISPISPLGPSTGGPILKNMIRYSESANEFASAAALSSSNRSNNGIKKSNSVRFNDCLTTNGNCSSSNNNSGNKNNHPKLRNSTSDYVSMEMLSRSHSNGNNQQSSTTQCNTVVMKSTSFFENPNYQNFENPTPSPGGNSEEDSYELQRISRDSEEPDAIIDSSQYEIMTPNYLLLIGGQEHGVKKKDMKNENNSITLWRLRVSSELIELRLLDKIKSDKIHFNSIQSIIQSYFSNQRIN